VKAQFPGRRVTTGRQITAVNAEWLRGATKSPSNDTSTFFNTVHLLPKSLSFEHGSAKLASCLGRHLTLLRPCLHQILHQTPVAKNPKSSPCTTLLHTHDHVISRRDLLDLTENRNERKQPAITLLKVKKTQDLSKFDKNYIL